MIDWLRSHFGDGDARTSAAGAVRVDPTARYQTVEGWGTSLAWWAHVLGGWSEPKRNEIADLLFSPSAGLGLTVVRYNIGGGDDPTHHHMRPGGDVPGFAPAPGVWDWNADANQRWMLAAAQARCGQAGTHPYPAIVEAFSNSPPYWMTRSGCAAGSADGSDNLQVAAVDTFAAYLAEVVAHFRGAWDTVFRTIEPFNEPSATWWKTHNKQEGCHFSREMQRAVVARLAAQLAAHGLTETAIAVADENNIDDMVATIDAYDGASLSYVAQVNTHSYNGTRRADLRARAAGQGKRLWMSEYGTGGGPHDHDAIAPALTLAAQIRRDMTDMQPSAWVYWQAIEREAGNNWGFIHADFSGASEQYWLTKQYYAMAQYSTFIRPGYAIIATDDASTLAAYDDASSGGTPTLVLVCDNATTQDRPLRYDLSHFGRAAGSATVYRTSATENRARVDDGGTLIADGVLATTAPAQSITSYIVTGVGTAA